MPYKIVYVVYGGANERPDRDTNKPHKLNSITRQEVTNSIERSDQVLYC